ncbi:glycosyl hydrolases family 6 domain-containing protein [Sarocladium implicatum]|nr:glycosyl hydrolases family 6 domain-containing protein [Sarocladium implicatum]
MRTGLLLAAGLAASGVTATRFNLNSHRLARRQADNPFNGKKLTANPEWGAKLEPTYEKFIAEGDTESAGKIRTIQDIGTFFWVSNIASLPNIDDAIAAARAEKEATGEDQIVGLVVYNLPDRDCSAGESAGELDSADGGLERYKSEYIDPYAEKLAAATDVSFAVVLEPDSLANLVTNMGVEFCAQAAPVYREGIAYAINSLQYDHVNLYIDAAHGGWLGWDDNLPLTAAEFQTVVELARETNAEAKIRGFVTNVSNYNPFVATQRENFTEWSNSWDESHYADSLAPHLEEAGLPSRFIIDQGRVAQYGAREEWGEWCNVSPAGFGIQPGTPVNNTHVDSIVWVKPGGESDGRCGLEGAPAAGAWFPEYVEMLVEYADSSIKASPIE